MKTRAERSTIHGDDAQRRSQCPELARFERWLRATALEDAVAEREGRGFGAQFVVREGGRFMCGECRAEFDANEVTYPKGRRADFETDPGEQSLVAALQCPKCRARGTYAFTYGPAADANEAEILRILRDQRKHQRPPI